LLKTISESGVQFNAEAIDDSDGHYRDTRSNFNAVEMEQKAT
jgi:hypothetical protein